jgi:hypothetical protein
MTPGVTLFVLRVTLHVTPGLETGPMDVARNLALRRFAHEVARRDVERCGQLANGIHARLTTCLEAGDRGPVYARQLGELQLNEPALHTPVEQGRGRGQGRSRHSSADGSRERRRCDSVATWSKLASGVRRSGCGHGCSVRRECVAAVRLRCSIRVARPVPVLLNTGGPWSCRRTP